MKKPAEKKQNKKTSNKNSYSHKQSCQTSDDNVGHNLKTNVIIIRISETQLDCWVPYGSKSALTAEIIANPITTQKKKFLRQEFN